MEDTAKYLIHATVSADGVVERSDVVGAIFGQTEGLLGEQLDLRELQQSSKIGRIDVEVDVTRGQTEGTVTIASGLDRVATATLAASLETMTRIGPCQAHCEVTGIEDVRAAKRREVVERAKELLNEGFDDTVMSSDEILREVREHVRVEDVTEYEGFPAGPRVGDSDAIIVVEGRSDVLQLLKYGIKNAIAVEGTDVPESVANLTAERTVTAFLDGDRGGDLILRELAAVGDVDYVALAPADKSVEDLAHHEVFEALREKVPYETVAGASDPREAVAATDGSTTPAPGGTDSGVGGGESEGGTSGDDGSGDDGSGGGGSGGGTSGGGATSAGGRSGGGTTEQPTSARGPETAGETAKHATGESTGSKGSGTSTATDAAMTPEAEGGSDAEAPDEATATHGPTAESVDAETEAGEGAEREAPGEAAEPKSVEPASLSEHAQAVVGAGTGEVVLLDDTYAEMTRGAAADAFDLLKDADVAPHAVVLDAELTQRVLDVAGQRGVDHVVAAELGDFVKRPTSVRIRTADELNVQAS